MALPLAKTPFDRIAAPSFWRHAAGDVFNGALAVALVAGEPLMQAVRFANAAAALSVTREGAQSSAPNRGAVEQFIRMQGTGTRDVGA